MTEEITVKAAYSEDSNEVIGYYPSFVGYKNIPETFITISQEEWGENRSRRMIVKDGIYQEYTDSEDEIISKKKSILINQRKNYLTKTDWYIAREFDSPNSYPIKIKQKRIKARVEINQIQKSITLSELNLFSEVFE